jgi:tRNA threonylcarbamoyladenosine biosynthesis protein TsaB
MRILSIETATAFGGVALVEDGRVVATAGSFTPRTASLEMLPATEALFEGRGYSIHDVDLIAVSTGPGLFTGVRVGMAMAKALAWARRDEEKCRLVGVSTLQSVAMLVLESTVSIAKGGRIVAVTDARRGEVYGAMFTVGDAPGELRRVSDDLVVRPERLGAVLAEKYPEAMGTDCRLVCIGDGLDKYGDAILSGFDPVAESVAYAGLNLSRAVAELGSAVAPTQTSKASELLTPNYVRRPDARRPVLRTDFTSNAGE